MATTSTDKLHARGVLDSQKATDDGKHLIVLSIPETSYELHLVSLQALETAIGKRAIGTIRVQARRMDSVETGGRYVEPVYGRPRRVQGRVIAIEPASNAITVDAGVPIECRLNKHQKASDFAEGDFVSGDVLPGATFAPVV
ncbi:MAG: hypothetical protein AAGI30_05735 [Planctomycetota bacterium]